MGKGLRANCRLLVPSPKLRLVRNAAWYVLGASQEFGIVASLPAEVISKADLFASYKSRVLNGLFYSWLLPSISS